MINLRKVKFQNGSSLIEAILALGFSVAIITAVVVSVITSLNNSSFTKSQNLATQYAQEGIDVARYMKTSDYASFRALGNSYEGAKPLYCINDEDSILQVIESYETYPTEEEIEANPDILDGRFFSCSKGDGFGLEIFVDHGTALVGGRNESGASKCDVGSSYVASIVSWTDSRCVEGTNCHKVRLDTCLSNLNELKPL